MTSVRKSAVFVFFAILLAVTSILAPMPDAFKNINITGSGGQLGLQTASAADLSPVTVGTSTTSTATTSSDQRKTFYGASRFWVFYDNGTDLVYKSSLDGATWTLATVLVAGLTDSKNFSLWWDSTYIHFTYASGVVDSDLHYRRGLPNEDGTITLGAEQLSPVTIGQSTYSSPVYNPAQRKMFYTLGYWWVFYIKSDTVVGHSLAYASSPDGVAWTEKDDAFSDCYVYSATYFDGTYVHVAYCNDDAGTSLFYRRGTPASDGTITWTAEQTAVSAVGGTDTFFAQTITMDSYGKVIIGYGAYLETTFTACPWVTRNTATDGTWSTDVANSFPVKMNTTNSWDWGVTVVPRATGFMAIYGRIGQVIKSKEWTVAGWAAEAATVEDTHCGTTQSAVTTSDGVTHMAWMEEDGHDIYYSHYHSDGADWEADELLYTTVSVNTAFPAICKYSNDDVICFWLDDPTNSHIYYKERISGTWDVSPTDWITDVTSWSNELTCIESETSHHYIGLAWGGTAVSPYTVRFAALGIGAGAEHNVVTRISTSTYLYPFISTDSSGYPAISYICDNGTDTTPYVTKANQSDGTWISDNFNTQLSTTDDDSWRSCVLPVASQDLIAIYAQDTATIKSKVYDCSVLSFLSENATASAIEFSEAFSAVVTDDNVTHMVFEYADDDIVYTHYHSGGTAWETEEDVYVGSSATKAPVLSRTLEDNLYCFWMGDNETDHIYYKAQVEGTWDTTRTEWLAESDITDNASISCAYEMTTTNYVPVVWLTGAGSPYNVRFAALERDIEPWLPGYADHQFLSVAGSVTDSSYSLNPETAYDQIYTTNGTFTVPAGVTKVAVLIVGGGGGGGTGGFSGGGGGAGGVRYFDNYTTTPGENITVTVGAGGAAATGDNDKGDNGQASVFGIYTSAGGGGGGSYTNSAIKNGADGGSGGGAAYHTSTGTGGVDSPVTDPVQGTHGGTTASQAGGGGGGASAVGSNGTANNGGKGGNGTDYSSVFGTSIGVSGWVGGGGGGAGYTTAGAGGTGGGGKGQSGTAAVAGTANTGGGGGGGLSGTANPGKAGGSGLVVIKYYTYSSVLDDKISINLFRGAPTVENGTWTVNGESYNYRVPFSIHTNSQLDNDTYSIRVVVDTATLVTGGMTTDNWEMGKRVEWANENQTYSMKYWAIESTSGNVTSIKNWNTRAPGTTYFICPQQTLSAYTEYTYYFYVDPDIDNDSANYGGAGAVGSGGLFEHFNTDCDNLTEFLSTYTLWETDPGAAAITIDNSTLTLEGVGGSGWDGIATTAGGFSSKNLRVLFGYASKPDINAATGIFDAEGIGGVNLDGQIMTGMTSEWTYYVSNVATYIDKDLWTTDGPFIIEMSKYGAYYRSAYMRDDPSATHYPDSILDSGKAVGDYTHKVIVATYYGTGYSLSLDFVFATNTVELPPYVSFPDITYEQIGTVFCDNEFSSDTDWYNEVAFTRVNDLTELYWCIDDLAQLTKQPGDSKRVVVRYTEPILDNVTIICFWNNATATGVPTYCSKENVYNTSSEVYRYDSFTMPPAWTDNADYALYDRVEGAPTGVQNHYNISIDGASYEGSEQIYGASTYWSSQTFKPTENYTITSADIYIHRHGGLAGNFYVSVRATENSTGTWKPTGTDLCSGYIVASGIALTTSSWYKISFGAGVHLEVDVTYALVVRAPNGTASKYVHWQYDTSAPTYAGGSYGDSTDGGSTWAMTSGYDFLFETYEGSDRSNLAYICKEAHNSGDYDGFDSALADGAWSLQWTTKVGSWSSVALGEPMVSKGEVGNVGGESGRFWGREATVVKNGEDDYRCFLSNARWEVDAAQWPFPFDMYWSSATSLDGPWSSSSRLFLPYWKYITNPWVEYSFVDNSTCYLMIVGTDGFELFYSSDNFQTWTANTNDEFLGPTWINAAAGAGCVNVMSHAIQKVDGVWWGWLHGLNGDSAGKSYWAHTTDDPKVWDNESWEYHSTGPTHLTALEDGDFAYDGSRYWYAFSNAYPYTDSPCLHRYSLDTNSYTFPGVEANWTAGTIITMEQPPNLYATRCVRLIKDDDEIWRLVTSGAGVQEAVGNWTRWAENTIYQLESTTLSGSWSCVNTEDRYKQATSTGVNLAYVTDSNKLNGRIIVDIVHAQTGKYQAGIVFRYNPSTNAGLATTLDYNNSSGMPLVRLWRMAAGANPALTTELGTHYHMVQFPSPQPYPGSTNQLRVDYYDDNITVYLSRYGNEWIECISYDLNGAYTFGNGSLTYGVVTSAAVAYFDNFVYADYVIAEPYLSSAQDSLAITVSPATWTGFYKESTGSSSGGIRENTWYSSDNDSNKDFFTVTNTGFSVIDCLISSSDNWTGTGVTWDVSSTGTAGSATIGMWAGLDSDTGYGILIKPSACDVYNFLLTDLAPAGHDHFGLKVFTATSNGGAASMSGTVTLTAVIHA